MAEGSSGGGDSWSLNRLRRRPRKCTHEVKRDAVTFPKQTTEKKRVNSLPKHHGSNLIASHKHIRGFPDLRYAAEMGRDRETSPRNRWETVHDAPHYPDVKFIALPYYESLGLLVKPTTLYNNSFENSCTFYLTPSQASMIHKGRRNVDLFNAGDKYSVQVQVRIGLLEVTSDQHDMHPPGLMVYVNREQVPLPVFSTEPKKNLPIDATPYLVVDPFAPNVVKIVSNPTFQRFVTAIYLVKKQSWNTLLSRLRSKAVRVAYNTKAMIQQKLKNDAENDILTNSLRVSLVCPLGKIRMGTPCRPTTCDHVQCFDASIFLQMNEKKATWQCPVCNKTAYYDHLTIDEYFQDVVTSSNLPSSCAEIEIMADGEWRPMASAQPSNQRTLDDKKECSVHLDSSDGEVEVISCEAKESPRKPARRPRTPVPDYVDLVSSPSPPASPKSPSKLLPLKKRRRQPTPERRNVAPLTVIDLDSSSDVDDEEVKACTSTASSTTSSDSDFIQPITFRKQRTRYIANSSDSEASLSGPINYSSQDCQVSQEDEVNSTRVKSISYSINKAKSSATSIVIRKATNDSTPSPSTSSQKETNRDNDNPPPDSSSKTNNETNEPSRDELESVSNFLLSATSHQLMGVIDQVAENLTNNGHAAYNYFVDLNPVSSNNNNNNNSVICLDGGIFDNSIDETTSACQERTPYEHLMLAIAKISSGNENVGVADEPLPGPSNVDEMVEICDAVTSTGDVDFNYVHREFALQPEIVIECQGSIVTSTNDEQIHDKKVHQVKEPQSSQDAASKKNSNETTSSASQSEELSSSNQDIAVPPTSEINVSVCLEHLGNSSSSELSPHGLPTTDELCPDGSSTVDELSPTKNRRKSNSPRPNILKKK